MSTGSVVRKNLNDLSKPIELRELNRQLDWMWKKILGGLTAKDFSDAGMKNIITTIEKTVAEEILTDKLETNVLVAALAEMMVAKIGVAKIDYAQIVDMFANSIFTDTGIAGKFRIDGLEVTQAQIVDLIVSSFRLVSQDGKVYKVSVDANGEIVTEYVEDQADWMKDGKVPDGYSAVASSLTVGNVTSGNLYVSGAADIMKLTAKVLTADKGFINELTSTEIFASYLMANAAFVNLLRTTAIVGDESITIIAERASKSFRQESMPVSDIKPGDTWRIPSTGETYQAEDASRYGLKFYLESDGSLHYELSVDDGSVSLSMQNYDLAIDGIVLQSDSDGNIANPIRWILIQDIGMMSKEEFQHYVRIADDGLHVGAEGSTGEVVIDHDSVDVVLGGRRFSSFAANYVEFGNYQLRRTADGGLAFKMR